MEFTNREGYLRTCVRCYFIDKDTYLWMMYMKHPYLICVYVIYNSRFLLLSGCSFNNKAETGIWVLSPPHSVTVPVQCTSLHVS